MTAGQALYLYRLVFALFIVFASAQTFVQGWPAAHGGGHAAGAAHIRFLAAAEIVAALAFLWPPAQIWAGGALVAIFAVATVIDLSMGGAPVRFAYYAATVAVIVFLDGALRSGAAAR